VLSRAAIGLGLIGEGQQSSTPGSAGDPALATVVSAGADSDLIFSSIAPGTELNGVTIIFQDTGPGPDAVDYDPAAGTLTFEITALATRANDIVTLLAGDPVASTLFAAAADPADSPILNTITAAHT
jgi:hypothetical protein